MRRLRLLLAACALAAYPLVAPPPSRADTTVASPAAPEIRGAPEAAIQAVPTPSLQTAPPASAPLELHYDVYWSLLRLVTILPHAFALGLLSILSSLLWLVAALGILFTRTCPGAVFRYQRGMLRWMGRAIAYHASLVDRYPPFALDTEATDPASAAS